MPLSVKVGGSWTEVGEVYVKVSGTWQKVAETIPLDAANDRNFRSFTSSGTMTIPLWATRMYYCIVGGGAGGGSGAGGQIVQGSTTSLGTRSLTIGVGGAGAASSVAISGGSTFSAAGASGVGRGGAGTLPAAPLNVAYVGGGGGNAATVSARHAGDFSVNIGGGGSVLPNNLGGGGAGAASISWQSGLGPGGSPNFATSTFSPPGNGEANSGGGGGAPSATGGSGVVLLYFS
jgi:hypothetical protein